MALTPEEIQHRLDFEILVDCYDEYEIASAWQIYFEETLEFPFTATARLKKRGGFEENAPVNREVFGLFKLKEYKYQRSRLYLIPRMLL